MWTVTSHNTSQSNLIQDILELQSDHFVPDPCVLYAVTQ